MTELSTPAISGTVVDMSELIAKFNGRFRYVREEGKLYYRVGPNRGKEAGTKMSNGYLKIGLEGKEYLVHRIIWLLEKGNWPGPHLDHKDHNTEHNHIDNLQDRGVVGNAMNRKGANSNNKLGARGIHILPSGNYRLMVGGKHRGVYSTIEQATQAAEVYRERYISNRG